VNLTKSTYADVLVLSPVGRLDHDNCAAFHSAMERYLEEASSSVARGVVFDLAGLDYVSSAGLRCFMLAAKQARAHGGKILIAAMQPVVGEIFEISRFSMILEAFPTVRAALESLSPESVQAYDRT
jgi:anti-anti-sigma factor